MLCQFTFQNFKSYKNETTLDYQAAVLPEFKNTLITETSASDLLPVNVVYGPNGGGKSNLLQALACVISTIVKPVNELGKNRQGFILQQKIDAVPFLFDEISKNEPIEFRIFFRIEKNEYCYYLALKNDEVISESLYRKAVSLSLQTRSDLHPGRRYGPRPAAALTLHAYGRHNPELHPGLFVPAGSVENPEFPLP